MGEVLATVAAIADGDYASQVTHWQALGPRIAGIAADGRGRPAVNYNPTNTDTKNWWSYGDSNPDLLHAMPADSVWLHRAASDSGRSG